MSQVKPRSVAETEKGPKRLTENGITYLLNDPYEGEEGNDDSTGQGSDDSSDGPEEEEEDFYAHEKRGPAKILTDAK